MTGKEEKVYDPGCAEPPEEACDGEKGPHRAIHYLPPDLHRPIQGTLASCGYVIVNARFLEVNKIKNSGPQSH